MLSAIKHSLTGSSTVKPHSNIHHHHHHHNDPDVQYLANRNYGNDLADVEYLEAIRNEKHPERITQPAGVINSNYYYPQNPARKFERAPREGE